MEAYGFQRLGDGLPGQFTRVGCSGVLLCLRAEASRGRVRLLDGVALPSFIDEMGESNEYLAELELLWLRHHAYWPLDQVCEGRPARLRHEYAHYLRDVMERLLHHDSMTSLRERVLGKEDDDLQRVRYALHLSRIDGDSDAQVRHQAHLDRLIREAQAGGDGMFSNR